MQSLCGLICLRVVVVCAGQAKARSFEAQYEVLEVIGSGSYATVRKCRHKKSREVFAVKIFKVKDITEKQRKLLSREVALMRKVGLRPCAPRAGWGPPSRRLRPLPRCSWSTPT